MNTLELLPYPSDYAPPSAWPFYVIAAVALVPLFLCVILLLRISIQISRSQAMKEFDTLKSLVPAACAALKDKDAKLAAKDAQIADLTAQLAAAQANTI